MPLFKVNGGNLKDLRLSRGLSVRQLALDAKVKRDTIQRWEQGSEAWAFDSTLAKVAHVLKVDWTLLVLETDPPDPPPRSSRMRIIDLERGINQEVPAELEPIFRKLLDKCSEEEHREGQRRIVGQAVNLLRKRSVALQSDLLTEIETGIDSLSHREDRKLMLRLCYGVEDALDLDETGDLCRAWSELAARMPGRADLEALQELAVGSLTSLTARTISEQDLTLESGHHVRVPFSLFELFSSYDDPRAFDVCPSGPRLGPTSGLSRSDRPPK